MNGVHTAIIVNQIDGLAPAKLALPRLNAYKFISYHKRAKHVETTKYTWQNFIRTCQGRQSIPVP
jgi:hypothetical protein